MQNEAVTSDKMHARHHLTPYVLLTINTSVKQAIVTHGENRNGSLSISNVIN